MGLLDTPSFGDEYPNALGWTWLIQPVSTKFTNWSQAGVVSIIEEDKEGAFTITAAWKPSDGTAYRAVVFDKEKRRYLPTGSRGGGSNGIQMTRYQFSADTIPSEEVAYVGIEILTPEGWATASRHALKEAKEAGIEILPLPQVGKPYSFSLKAVDEKIIQSEDLKGKVVILDCWATWCAPCMRKMPELREAYSKWHGKEFEIIGINFDQDLDNARDAIQNGDLVWPQVYVPSDKGIRDLWFKASSIRTLPRLLLIDREGNLRLDTNNPGELKPFLAALMEKHDR